MVRGERKKKKKHEGRLPFPALFFPRQFLARALIFRLPAHHLKPSEHLEQARWGRVRLLLVILGNKTAERGERQNACV